MGQAFDQAWTEIVGNYGDDPFEVEIGRLRLAEAVLSVATKESTDVATLKAGALQVMAGDYRSGIRRALGPAQGIATALSPARR
jgi:hypothetical protein